LILVLSVSWASDSMKVPDTVSIIPITYSF